MIYKLIRRQNNRKSPLGLTKSQLPESLFIEQISRLIKIIRKQQQLYIRLLDQSIRQSKSFFDQNFSFVKEYDKNISQQKQLSNFLASFKIQPFYSTKTYLYTVFMRIHEIWEIAKQKAKILGKKQVEKNYEEAKRIVNELYNNLTYFEKYDIMEIIDFVTKNQIERLLQFLPRKKLGLLQPISKQKKMLQRVKQSEKDFMRKTISVEIIKNKKQDLKVANLISKKLLVKELATQLRSDQRKIKKNKKNLFKLYDILDIKPLAFDKTTRFQQQLEINMLDRNSCIKEQMKRWQKQYLLFKFCHKKRQE